MKLSEQLGMTDQEFEARKLALKREYEAERRQRYVASVIDDYYREDEVESELHVIDNSEELNQIRGRLAYIMHKLEEKKTYRNYKVEPF